MSISPLAGKPAPAELLIDVDRLIRDYYERQYRVDYKATIQPKPQHVYRGGKVAVERFRRLPPIFKLSSSFRHSWVTARSPVPLSHALPRTVMNSKPKFAGSFGAGRSVIHFRTACTVAGQSGQRRLMPVFGRG